MTRLRISRAAPAAGKTRTAALGEKKVVVPEAYLSTPSVLIMEYVPGKMLVDALQDHFETVAQERGMTIDELR